MACYLGTDGLAWSIRKQFHNGCFEIDSSD